MGYVIGLTGGIASGKTAVSDRFAGLGVPVIDTDVIARELVMPGQPLLVAIAEAFGPRVLLASGELDRRQLRDIVFSDPDQRHRLEELLHPAIRAEALNRARAVTAPYCILVIPLLAESGDFPGIDRVLLVDVPREVQLQRLMARDDVSQAQAEAALAAQASRSERRALADDIIDNAGPVGALDQRVGELHERYLALAKSSLNRDAATREAREL